MKLKGISRAEQFADKIVFAAFALFLVFVLVMQVGLLGGTGTVKIAGKDVPLDQADRALKAIADAKRARMESDRVDEGIPASLPSALAQYKQAMAKSRPGENHPRLTRLVRPTIKGEGATAHDTTSGVIASSDADFNPFVPPTPSKPILSIFEGTIDPISVVQVGADLAKALPSEQPFDVRTVTILSIFDAAELRAALTGDRGGPPIPNAFWQGRVELFDVRIVRQEKGSDGQWGGEVTLEQIPGRFSMRQTLAREDLNPLNMRGFLDDERAFRESIRRPRFYSAVSGERWTWPALQDAGADPAKQARIERLQRELRGVRSEIDRLNKLLNPPTTPPTPPGAPPRNPPKNPPGGPPGDRGSRGGPGDLPSAPFARNEPRNDDDSFIWPDISTRWLAQGPPGGGGRPPTPPAPKPDPKVAWTRQLAEFKKRETDLVKDLEGLGMNLSPTAPSAQAEQFDEPLASLTDAATQRVTLWAHDLTAAPGAEYRYKARIVVTNPFFGQAERLKDSLRSLAAPVVAASADSPWSDPVAIPPRTLYFLRSASEAGQDPIANQSRASIDIYEFYYGYWRRASAALTPGDPVVATTDELPVLETWRIEKSAEGKWAVGAGTAVERRRRLSAGAILLDVLSIIVGGDRAGASALLADSSGRLFSMSPNSSSDAAALRARIEASMSASQKAVVRLPEGEPTTPDGSPSDPGRPPSSPPTPPSSPDDSGGGGGNPTRD